MIPRDDKEVQNDELVELRFLEGVSRRCPNDTKVLKALGDLYTRLGQLDAGLQVDLKLSKLCPTDETVWYNLGCSYALLGQSDKAFEILDRAIDLGYDDAEWMGEDEDLDSLREDKRYERLIYRVMLGVSTDNPSRSV